ncbi:MAG: glutamate-5-semialdehyde dehydrogenase [Solirubrobacterales bacterium]
MEAGSIETGSRSISEDCAAVKAAARTLAASPSAVRNRALASIAAGLLECTDSILAANAEDLADDHAQGLSEALIDRLRLDRSRIEAMADGVRAVAALDDPVGEIIETRTLKNGIELSKVRVPLGVVAVVYEARPNVTVDCAALTVKSGNAILLRGSSYAERTNTALAKVVRDSLSEAGLPADSVVLSTGGGRDQLAELATQEGVIDLLIPRGGEGLKNALKDVATVPVMYAASGNCHIYVHSDADLEMARAIVINAKVSRPGVCNAAETLLVDASVATGFLAAVLPDLRDAGVELVGDERTIAASDGVAVAPATQSDWDIEFLELKLAVAVVDDLDTAIDHINRHGSGHSEAIVTRSEEAAERFTTEVDAAAVYVNASTRFTDGFEYEMGAEIGISTQKLHARGPIGLRELTTFKYVGRGDGQIRG